MTLSTPGWRHLGLVKTCHSAHARLCTRAARCGTLSTTVLRGGEPHQRPLEAAMEALSRRHNGRSASKKERERERERESGRACVCVCVCVCIGAPWLDRLKPSFCKGVLLSVRTESNAWNVVIDQHWVSAETIGKSQCSTITCQVQMGLVWFFLLGIQLRKQTINISRKKCTSPLI